MWECTCPVWTNVSSTWPMTLTLSLFRLPPYRNLRYGEVISDVMEYIFNDRSKNEFIASDILARVSRLPEHQRTISTVLRMISDDIMSSVILTDNSHNTLNIAPWPQSVEKELLSCLPRLYRSPEDTSILESFMPGCSVYSLPVIPDSDSPMRLYIIKGGGPLSRILRSQAADIVRICVNIWGKGHGAVAVRELIRSIIQDDPLKMHRLADIFHIDISQIHEMWVVSGDEHTAELLREQSRVFCGYLKSCSDIVFSDVYEDKLLIFSSTPYSERGSPAAGGKLPHRDFFSGTFRHAVKIQRPAEYNRGPRSLPEKQPVSRGRQKNISHSPVVQRR